MLLGPSVELWRGASGGWSVFRSSEHGVPGVPCPPAISADKLQEVERNAGAAIAMEEMAAEER